MNLGEILDNTVGLSTLTPIQKFKILEVVKTITGKQIERIENLEAENKSAWEQLKDEKALWERRFNQMEKRNEELADTLDRVLLHCRLDENLPMREEIKRILNK
jgi:hypothetical protein